MLLHCIGISYVLKMSYLRINVYVRLKTTTSKNRCTCKHFPENIIQESLRKRIFDERSHENNCVIFNYYKSETLQWDCRNFNVSDMSNIQKLKVYFFGYHNNIFRNTYKSFIPVHSCS